MTGFAEVHSSSGAGPFPLLSFPTLTMCAHVFIDRAVSSRRTYICVLIIVSAFPLPPTLSWDSLIPLLQSSNLAFGSEFGTRLLPLSFFPFPPYSPLGSLALIFTSASAYPSRILMAAGRPQVSKTEKRGRENANGRQFSHTYTFTHTDGYGTIFFNATYRKM